LAGAVKEAFNVTESFKHKTATWRGFPPSVTKKERQTLKTMAQNTIVFLWLAGLLLTADISFIMLHLMDTWDTIQLNTPAAQATLYSILGLFSVFLVWHIWIMTRAGRPHKHILRTAEYNRLFRQAAATRARNQIVPHSPQASPVPSPRQHASLQQSHSNMTTVISASNEDAVTAINPDNLEATLVSLYPPSDPISQQNIDRNNVL